jgi:hypothetical protein
MAFLVIEIQKKQNPTNTAHPRLTHIHTPNTLGNLISSLNLGPWALLFVALLLACLGLSLLARQRQSPFLCRQSGFGFGQQTTFKLKKKLHLTVELHRHCCR